MRINYFLAILIGFISSAILTRVFYSTALKRKSPYSKSIPTIGGPAIGAAFLFSSLSVIIYVSYLLPYQYIGLIMASLVMLALGFIDDLRELSVQVKFLTQSIAVLVLMAFGIRTRIVFLPVPVNFVITYIWLIGITNAFNLLDIIDGLAGAVAFIVSIAFFVISYLNLYFNVDVDYKLVFSICVLLSSLAGAVLGFLIFNLPPALCYMGNSGSHFLGFILGAVALTISFAGIENKVALFSPLLILGLPLLDTFFLIFIRLHKGKIPFKKSNDHIVLRLLSVGYSKNRILLVMVSLCLYFASSGVLLMWVRPFFGVGIVCLVILAGLSIALWSARIKIDG